MTIYFYLDKDKMNSWTIQIWIISSHLFYAWEFLYIKSLLRQKSHLTEKNGCVSPFQKPASCKKGFFLIPTQGLCCSLDLQFTPSRKNRNFTELHLTKYQLRHLKFIAFVPRFLCFKFPAKLNQTNLDLFSYSKTSYPLTQLLKILKNRNIKIEIRFFLNVNFFFIKHHFIK